MKFFISFLILIPQLCIASNIIDVKLKKTMLAYKVPVVGYAIIDQNRIVAAKTISINATKTSLHSLFQAASISKSMTAYAILFLIDKGKINLGAPANQYLTEWKIPKSKLTKNNPVHINNLMDMTSGITVSGFSGYTKDEELPSHLDILNGKKPANNEPIRVFYRPGTRYFYSSGAFQILEQVITSITKQNFNLYMNKEILRKIGMNDSIYQYPLKNKKFLSRVIPGYKGWSGESIKGGWYNYMCAGACGMWSTPSDLAKFALNITASYLGKSGALISTSLAHKMLTRQKNTDFGFGVVVAGTGKNLYFWKAGHNYGYHSLLIMFPNQGKGLAIMTNSETGNIIIDYMTAIVAHEYHWPYYFPFFDELIEIPDY